MSKHISVGITRVNIANSTIHSIHGVSLKDEKRGHERWIHHKATGLLNNEYKPTSHGPGNTFVTYILTVKPGVKNNTWLADLYRFVISTKSRCFHGVALLSLINLCIKAFLHWKIKIIVSWKWDYDHVIRAGHFYYVQFTRVLGQDISIY